MVCRGRCLSVLLLWGCLLALATGCLGPAATEDRSEAVYVTMRDGTRIAVDVWKPKDLEEGERLPTIMRMTRYWRGLEFVRQHPDFDGGMEEPDLLNERGYILVVVDARGTGASFGVSEAPWSVDEVQDYREVVDWVVAQPWSNGRVGSYGVSYEGNTALLLGSVEHPAVKVVVPRFVDLDPYRSPGRPGGVLTDTFLKSWHEQNAALDANNICGLFGDGFPCSYVEQYVSGVKLVDADTDGSLLAEAVAEHAGNVNVYEALKSAIYVDDSFGTQVDSLVDIAPHTYLAALERSGTAVFSWASWMDAGTATDAIAAYLSTTNPHRVIIGPWNHGADEDANPFAPYNQPVGLTEDQQLVSIFNYLDSHLKDGASPDQKRHIRYYTMNEDVWRTTTTWPPKGLTAQSWYFDSDGYLSPEAPTAAAARDTYTVDFTATAGDWTRWHTQNGGLDVGYPDRRDEDLKLLTYTSDPLADDLRVVGTAVVTLHVESTTTDCAFYAYLEDVAPDGRVTYVTEGKLRALHRKVSADDPPYTQFGPYHSYRQADGEAMTPGEVAEVTFGLEMTAVLFEAGHSIRVAIAGHDDGMFERIPSEGTPVWTVHRTAAMPSGIVMPVMP